MQTTGYLVLDGWAGRSYTKVEVVGSTRARWRIKAISDTQLAGRRRFLRRGDVALVPRQAVIFGAKPGAA